MKNLLKTGALLFLLATVAIFAASCSCGDDDDDDDDNDDDADDDTAADDDADDDSTPVDDDADDDTSDDDAGDDDEAGVFWEYVEIDGEPADPNPVTHATTPDAFNKIRLFRYRMAGPDGAVLPAEAIVILQAGYTAGVNQLTYLAKSLVEASEGAVEVWIPEKRHHLLEDHSIIDLAEERQDPYLALDYYVYGKEVEGQTYSDPDPYGPETDMMSEWSLDLWNRDLRRLVHLIPEDQRQTSVFLGGDSRGVAMTQAYAAWEFEDGTIGADELAGVICWDGGLMEYQKVNGLNYPQLLADIRTGAGLRYVNIVSSQFWFMETFAMAATEGFGDPDDPTLGPDGFFPEYADFAALFKAFRRGKFVKISNEAYFGMTQDSDYIPVSAYMGHVGRLTGGKLCNDILGEHPCEIGATYTWARYDETDPPELVDSQVIARMLYEGPSNFTDIYHSKRFELDLSAVKGFETEGTWAHDYFHVYSSRMKAPVFALVSKAYEKRGFMEDWRDAVAPVRGKAGPRVGDDFLIIYKTDWSHLDAIAVHPSINPIYPQLLEWIGKQTDGDVAVPRFGTVIEEKFVED
ncbi:hypothetical protein K8I61_14360 [bacterium]|nr:hypothetical protein [bacterium]